jgi:sugar phosphate isomerase/epimerase
MQMSWQVYPMDTGFFNSLGSYDFDVRCEVAKELGFDATYLTLWSDFAWEDVKRLGSVREKHGLDVAGVYVALDVSRGERDPEGQRIIELLRTLEGTDLVEVAVLSSDPAIPNSDPAGDGAALAWLERLVEAASERQVRIALYPHAGGWLERTADAARLCRALDHPLVGAVFAAFHWYAAGGQDLRGNIASVAPHLISANVCGSRRITGWVMPATIEPLDDGELDTFAVLAELNRAGYDGYVGIQGYSAGGDAYAKARRNLAAFRDIERRIEAHPHWAELRPDPLPLPSGAE